MKDLLIVDGYNFIFNFFKSGEMTGDRLEEIKSRLIADISEYSTQKDYKVIVVFDASRSENQKRRTEHYDGIEIIHSMAGETADSIIEELVSRWSGQTRIVVVTSDYSQQKVVFGKNTTRRSSREFGLELEAARKRIRNKIKKSTGKAFYHIEKRLDPGIRRKISDYRKR